MTRINRKNKSRKTNNTAAPTGNRRTIFYVVALLVLAFGGWAAYSLLNQPGDQGPTMASLPKEISVAEAHAKYEQGVFLLDVRTQGEWDESHVPGATLIPLDELESRLTELPRDQEIVVMCRSGNRSQTGRDILLNAGFESVTSMAGGITQWSAAGYPTEP